MKKNISLIKDVVLNMGGKIEEFLPERGCFYIDVLGIKILLENKITIHRDSFVSGQLTRCKDVTHKLLTANNISTPETNYFYNKNFNKIKAEEILSSMTYPVIIKDSCGSDSIGIFPFIKDKKETLKILTKELPKYHTMVAQQMVFGKEYRVLILGNKAIGALEMITPHIIGDGISTVKQLITKKQNATKRRSKFDKKLIQILQEQNVTLESIVPIKKIIYFKKNSCLAEGGETKNVTGIINKEVEKICVKAAKMVGKHLVGIDIICKDISKLPTKKTFYILEINGKPDLDIHYDPTYGQSQDVIKDIITFMAKLAKSKTTS